MQVIAKRKVVRVLEKELSDDEVGALLDLVTQAIPVDVASFRASDVPFRKPGNADGEIAGCADELNKLIRVLEAARRRRESGAVWRIAAQGQDVAHTQLAGVRENRFRFRPRGVHAGQMRHGRQPVLALNAVNGGERLGARATAGAVSDRTEIGRKAAQRRNGLVEQGPLAFVGPGREELDGNRRPRGAARVCENVANETHQGGTRFRAGDCGTALVFAPQKFRTDLPRHIGDHRLPRGALSDSFTRCRYTIRTCGGRAHPRDRHGSCWLSRWRWDWRS